VALNGEKLDETAASMAWTMNDELWETASEQRKDLWRGFARETVEALLLDQEQRKSLLDKLQERILREGLT
jgi:hypothetical protein